MRVFGGRKAVPGRSARGLVQMASLAALFTPTPAVGFQNFDAVQIEAEPVAGNIHVLFGAGGNIGVSTGSDGVFLVDDQYAPLTDKIKEAVSKLSDSPIRFVINTHFHGDHTGGNENLASEGSIIVAHDNVRTRLSKGAFIEAFNFRMQPLLGTGLPVVTFNSEMSLHLNGEEARIIHIPHAHTDGDALVHFRQSNVIHMGDTFFHNRLPFIDYKNGGSIGGVIAAASLALSLADETTRIIPGHGAVGGKADMQAYHDLLVRLRDRIASLKNAGSSLADLQADTSATLGAVPAPWRPGADDRGWSKRFIEFVYNSL